jgi:RNA polymerase sigma-70 factor, ECF subfamily
VERRVADVDLVRRARDGDRDAFDVLMTGAIDRLYRVARLSLHELDAAEDAVQEALVRCWRDLPQLRDPRAFESWLYRLLIHAITDESRRRQRSWAKVAVLTTDPSEPDSASAVADRDVLDRAFRRLSINHRTMVVLHHYVGLTVEDAATALGIPLGTAKSRLFYGMEALRTALTADGPPGAAEVTA